MKGFYIEIKNDLLDPKHVNAIAEAIWLFLWFLDKMTIINHETGEGKVLGGKPIKFDEVEKELGVSRRTYERWVEILRAGEYIETIRTPYGLSITVKKAKKHFGKRYAVRGTSNTTSVAHLNDDRGTSNKTVSVDNTVDGVLKNKTHPSEKLDSEIVATDEDGNERQQHKKSTGRNLVADRVANYFNTKAREFTGKPVLGFAYAIVKKLMEGPNAKTMTEVFLKQVVDDFFDSVPTDEKAVNPYVCFGSKNINRNLLA